MDHLGKIIFCFQIPIADFVPAIDLRNSFRTHRSSQSRFPWLKKSGHDVAPGRIDLTLDASLDATVSRQAVGGARGATALRSTAVLIETTLLKTVATGASG